MSAESLSLLKAMGENIGLKIEFIIKEIKSLEFQLALINKQFESNFIYKLLNCSKIKREKKEITKKLEESHHRLEICLLRRDLDLSIDKIKRDDALFHKQIEWVVAKVIKVIEKLSGGNDGRKIWDECDVNKFFGE